MVSAVSGRTGRERLRREGRPYLTALDVLLAALAGGALLTLLAATASWS